MPGRGSAAARLTMAGLGLMLLIYTAVYVMTPHDLSWHLRSSLDRVLLQFLPSMVWAGLLLASPPVSQQTKYQRGNDCRHNRSGQQPDRRNRSTKEAPQ